MNVYKLIDLEVTRTKLIEVRIRRITYNIAIYVKINKQTLL